MPPVHLRATHPPHTASLSMSLLVLKQTPDLFPPQWEYDEYLRIGSWPKIMRASAANELRSRWDLANAKQQLISEMLSEDFQEIWVGVVCLRIG